MSALRALPLVLAAACHDGNYLSYEWDERKVLCSFAIDDLSQPGPTILLEDEIRFAADAHRVVLVHAHNPEVTISRAMIERTLSLADRYGLQYFEYHELVPGEHRAGIALAFDDQFVDGWLSIRDLLDAHHAHVTFFITRYGEITDEQRAGIAELHAEGHGVEPHSVHHLHADAYVQQYGLDAYVANEVVPSIEVLEANGYPATIYAYPFGQHTTAMDGAILPIIGRVRVSPGGCPY